MGDGCAADAVGPFVFADDERKTENDTTNRKNKKNKNHKKKKKKRKH